MASGTGLYKLRRLRYSVRGNLGFEGYRVGSWQHWFNAIIRGYWLPSYRRPRPAPPWKEGPSGGDDPHAGDRAPLRPRDPAPEGSASIELPSD